MINTAPCSSKPSTITCTKNQSSSPRLTASQVASCSAKKCSEKHSCSHYSYGLYSLKRPIKSRLKSHRDRLITVSAGNATINHTSQLIAQYGYDPLDRRLWKEQYRDMAGNPLAQAKRSYYLYADEGLIAEASQDISLNADSSVTATGTGAGAGNTTPVITTQYGPRPDSEFTTGLLFIKTKNTNGQDTVAYYHHDHLDTPIQATDKAGNIVWAASYNAFGQASITTPQATADKPTITSNLRLPGQYEDVETGLHYNWHRYYDAQIGRYVTSDPIGFAGGLNKYSYVGGNPLTYSDSKGLDCTTANGFTNCAYPGGPSFTIPAQPGFPDRISPWHPLHHAYDVVQPLGKADSQCVQDKLKNNPTPGSPSPATADGTRNNAELRGLDNWVKSYLTTNLKTGQQLVVNITGPDSRFGPGYVARTVTDGVVHTYGEGTHWIQSFIVPSLVKTVANELVWGMQMKQFVIDCSCSK